jgi:radical SAM superfamily enzyme YgiQ (UPF0313 family)
MKKLILINPVGQRSGMLLTRWSTFPPLSLAYIAAVTPTHWDVKIIDENFDTFEMEPADLVGITGFTTNITRAYAIAGQYREQGTAVIMGGIHVSMVPDEALQYADAIVIGEVENIWQQVIADFENKRLKPRYVGPRVDFEHATTIPRRELLHPDYVWQSIQTSRGCPFSCSFCSVSKYMGRQYRQRNVDAVLKDLEAIDGKYVFFLDDNLVGYSRENIQRSMNLFRGMRERNSNKKFWMQASINMADNEELVKLAARAGCMFVFIGFESISNDKLKQMRKGINLKIGVDNYRRVVDMFHKYGIAVLGSFVIGNDYESASYYKELADFLLRSGIDIVQITLLTALPGTELMNTLQQEGRLIFDAYPQDWDKYRFSHMIHQPQGLSIDDIYTGNNYIKNRIYTFPNYQYRLVKSFFAIKKLDSFMVAYKANQAYKKGWLNSHYHEKYPVRLVQPAGSPT